MNPLADKFEISREAEKMQIDAIHDFLSTKSYWAKNIPIEVVKKAISNSIPFGIFYDGRQIAFARVITDKATFAYLADVYVLEEFRGQGLSKWLLEFILQQEDLKNLRRFILATWDAHKLYEQFGFKLLEKPERMMEIKNENPYPAP